MNTRRTTSGTPALDGFTLRSVLPPSWPDLDPLIQESRREGFRFLVRLRDEWESGANRFDAPGEALLGAWVDGALVGIGGLNRDLFASHPDVGRLRHLYVIPAFRGMGVGRALVEALVSAARPHFGVLRLRTDTAAAARFYQALGFVPVDSPSATHQMEERRPVAEGD